MHKDPAAFVKIPLGAPMITPPANEALRISSMSNFYLKSEVIMKVPMQLPVREMMVFDMMVVLSNGVVGK